MHIKPKKRLGQNFLTDKNLQNKIIDACGFEPSDIVLEIGAGRGELTQLISPKVAVVFALEIDSGLYEILKERFEKSPNIKIINQNILKLNFKKYFSRIQKKIKVVGNIPYYITTPIIEYLLEVKDKIDIIFITVQKEFARRVTASPGSKDYGALSCFLQYYTEPKMMFNINKTCFYPAPKVDSCLLRLEVKQNISLNKSQEKLVFKIIRAAFGKRRKTLRNSLKGTVSPNKLNKFFKKFGIDPNIRPERLSLSQFINLAKV